MALYLKTVFFYNYKSFSELDFEFISLDMRYIEGLLRSLAFFDRGAIAREFYLIVSAVVEIGCVAERFWG